MSRIQSRGEGGCAIGAMTTTNRIESNQHNVSASQHHATDDDSASEKEQARFLTTTEDWLRAARGRH